MTGKTESTEEFLARKKMEVEELKRNYSGPHCCWTMEDMLEENEEVPLYNVQYSKKSREYSLKSVAGPYARTLDFCPWCGKKMLDSLRDVWFRIVREELHLDPSSSKDRKRIPAEFSTDEWWKKRRL